MNRAAAIFLMCWISLLAGIPVARGDEIFSVQKIYHGESDVVAAYICGDLKVVPQRDAVGRITGFEWGNATGTFVPAFTQTWQRGVGGRIESAGSDVAGAPAFDYLIDPNEPQDSFDARGRRLKCATAGGTWTYGYTNGRLTNATHNSLGSFSYTFDAIGRRLGEGPPEADPNETDLLNRTLAWTNDQDENVKIAAHPDARVWVNGTEVPNFNGQHNYAITSPGEDGGWVEWEALAILEGQGEGAGSPAPNPLASPDAKAEKRGAVWVPPANESFTFDAAGNRESTAQWDYGWDAKNQLVRARTKNHDSAAQGWDLTFSYDSEGRRFKKHVVEFRNGNPVAEKEVTFVWDGWDLIYERHQLPSGLTTLERKYMWGPDIAGGAAGGAGGLLLIRETKGNATTDLIPLCDGTGHVVALADSSGTLQASYAYGPFGELIHASGPAAQANPWRYATKYFDHETGLSYFGRRYFDPVTGQWLSREPLGERECLNLYSYCDSDPVNHLDVRGLAKVATDGKGGLTTFGKALLTIAGDDPEAARSLLMAAQVNRELAGRNIGERLGNGDGGFIGSVLSAIDFAVGTARSDGSNEWKHIAARIGAGFDFPEGAGVEQDKWTNLLFAEYAPLIAARVEAAGAFDAAQRAASAKLVAEQNSPGYKLREIAMGVADLPMQAGGAIVGGLLMTDITTGTTFTWDGWGNGYGLAEISPGERAFAAGLMFLPIGRGGSFVDDFARAGIRGGAARETLNTYGDALRGSLGPGRMSHADEWAATLSRAEGMGVKVVPEPGRMAYEPAFGSPGRLLIDPDASIGALRHEFQHIIDDAVLGHPGLRVIQDSNQFWGLEFRGYMQEINTARSIRDFGAGRVILQEMRDRRFSILGQ